jgi:polysaccharide lyase-like protein
MELGLGAIGQWCVRCSSVLLLAACQDNPYVIGRVLDDGCAEQDDAIVCAGFEQDDLSDWDDAIVVNVGEVERVETRAHRGRAALHATSAAGQSSAVVAREFEAVTDGELYLRTYLYVPADVDTKTINILFLGAFATPDPFQGVDINLEDGALQIYVPGSAPDRTTSTSLTIPRDRWFCLQAKLSVTDDDGAVELRVDGALALEQQGLDTRPDDGVHLLRAGVDWSSEQAAPFEVYVDDLVLATRPIACD